MDDTLRRYLNGLFALLVVDVGATLARPTLSLGRGLVLAAVFGTIIFAFLVRPDLLRASTAESSTHD